MYDEEAFMKWWQVALLVVYFAANLFLYIRLRKRPAPLSSDFVPGWQRPWIAIFWLWGATLWPIPGLCWLGVSALPGISILILSFFLPLIYFLFFLAFTKTIPFGQLRDRIFLIGLFAIVVMLFVLGAFFLLADLLLGKVSFVKSIFFLSSISVIPLFSILLIMIAPMFLIPMKLGTKSFVRESIRMVLGHFTSYPKTSWRVQDGQVQTWVKGNPFLGTGSGCLLTEPESLVVLKRGPKMTRIVGPGALLIEKGESPFRVVDLRNQIRSKKVTAMTKDGVEVSFAVSSLFRIDPGGKSVQMEKPWPYDEDSVWEAAFAGPVGPTSQTPLESNRAHPWQDLPLRVAVQKVKQAIGFYTFDQLYQDGTQPELVEIHRQVESIFGLESSNDVIQPLTRKSIGNLVQRAVRKQLAIRGFEILGGGIGSRIEPLSDQVLEQNVEDWKARFVDQITDWQSRIAQLQIRTQGNIRIARIRTLDTLIEDIDRSPAGNRSNSDIIAYWIVDSLMQITADPEVREMLSTSSKRTLEDLSAWEEAQALERER
jgi:hypothetical protein